MIDLLRIFVVSHRSLMMLAALVWYGGSLALFLKAGSLLIEAKAIRPEAGWLLGAVIGGFLVGALKGEFLFKKSCQKNLARIRNLPSPRIWQFFRPRFFLFMLAMILFGATLSRLAHNNHLLLIVVAFIDLTIAVALLWSSRNFWKKGQIF